MKPLRVALATAGLLLCAPSDRVAAEASDRMSQQTMPASAAERERPGTDSRARERTPPPRPIVPPEGQQENPALREECAWLGQRIVSLLFRDDPMTGSDFTPFYARFGCPDEHLRLAFACVVHSGIAENDVLADRIAACWADPEKKSRVPAQPPARPQGAPASGQPESPAPAPNHQPNQQPAQPSAQPPAAPADAAPPAGGKPADAPSR